MKRSLKTLAVVIGIMAGYSVHAQTTKTTQNSQSTKEHKVNKSSSNANGQKKSTENKQSSSTKNSPQKTKQGENPSMKAPNNIKNDSLRNQDKDRYFKDNYKDSRSGTNDFSGARDSTRQFNKNSNVKDTIKRDTI
jgi:hypothetical protein